MGVGCCIGRALGGRWRVTGGEGWVWESDL